ncbi:hypothetical protein LIER_21141 [Lithospermum erythrorhizon]|uniref:Uncharacterized protein n=1 Tax=Lithospermum erythrorhizon TaxID=34254 RepID=A0AAV3QSK3_LITER
MEPNLPSRPGVSTRAQSALGGGEARTRPSSIANPPKKTSKIPRTEPSKGARIDIPTPHPTKEPDNINAREEGDPIPHHERPRQNLPHHNTVFYLSPDFVQFAEETEYPKRPIPEAADPVMLILKLQSFHRKKASIKMATSHAKKETNN